MGIENHDIRQASPNTFGDGSDRFGSLWKTHIDSITARFQDQIEGVFLPIENPIDVPVIFVKKEGALELLEYLKTKLAYNFLADLTATDEQPDEFRFQVVYNLFSHTNLNRIRVKVRLADGESMPTAIGVWKGANWAEREVWDMFGIRFDGHPDLRRILMDQRWEGHPLRKDYPLRGYQFFPDPEPIDEERLK